METVSKPVPCIFHIVVKNSHKSMFKNVFIFIMKDYITLVVTIINSTGSK